MCKINPARTTYRLLLVRSSNSESDRLCFLCPFLCFLCFLDSLLCFLGCFSLDMTPPRRQRSVPGAQWPVCALHTQAIAGAQLADQTMVAPRGSMRVPTINTSYSV